MFGWCIGVLAQIEQFGKHTSRPGMFGTQMYGLGAHMLSALFHLACGCSLLVCVVIYIAVFVGKIYVAVSILNWIRLRGFYTRPKYCVKQCLATMALVVYLVVSYFWSYAYALVELVHAQTYVYSCTDAQLAIQICTHTLATLVLVFAARVVYVVMAHAYAFVVFVCKESPQMIMWIV